MGIVWFIVGYILGFLAHGLISYSVLSKVRDKYCNNYINERLLRREGLGHLLKGDKEFDIFMWLGIGHIFKSISKFINEKILKKY